jgi:hypothetical protein
MFRSPFDLTCKAGRVAVEFTVAAGERISFTLQYGLSYQPEPPLMDVAAAIGATTRNGRTGSRPRPIGRIRSSVR